MESGSSRLKVVWMLLICQFAGCALFSAAALVNGIVTAYSVLLGGLICLLPNMYFAYRAFSFQGARAAKQIVRSFYAGEAGKLALTTILFAGVFIGVKPLNALALFIGYCGVQLISWIVPLVYTQHRKRPA